ncbi:MAG: tRNA 2-thiouridine(34) synthase MnmA [Lentisphaerae bacterium]|nr:tRNA 2-thiouridine(34) synthase MnmA [Lentisphaerota bacterium]
MNNKQVNTGKIVAVGMSGGLDSTIAAYLLQQQGMQVIGLTMQTWDKNVAKGKSVSACCGPNEVETLAAAKKAADALGIQLYVVPLIDEFQMNVIEYFRAESRAGKTPNPCVVCNQKLKFGLLPNKAQSLGIEFAFFATGHYVRSVFNPETNRYRLLKGLDPNKDQSYFLFQLTQTQLRNIIFPLGEMTKNEAEKIAVEAGFDFLLERKQSMDFVENGDYSGLLEEVDEQPGKIIDTSGNILGEHKGIARYTIGQREGLGIAATSRLYVSKIDSKTNTITLAKREEVMSLSCSVDGCTWIAGLPPDDGMECKVKLRYRQKGVVAKIMKDDETTCRLFFREPQFAVTPGQVAVCYKDYEILGGGWITESGNTTSST